MLVLVYISLIYFLFKAQQKYTDVPPPLVFSLRFLHYDGENTEVQSDMETLDPW
jgi:hypothetical protein